MSQDESIDAGLAELTDDVLGPSANAEPESNTESSEQAAVEPTEQTQATATADAGSEPEAPQVAQAPEAPQQPTQQQPRSGLHTEPEPTYEVDFGDGRGIRQLTRSQIVQTFQQLPHLQKLWTDAKPKLDQMERQQAQTKADPRQIVQNIRSSFDSEVSKSVTEGFMEEDFAILYPNLAASMMLVRDSLTQTNRVVAEQAQKIAWYEGQQEVQSLRSNVENNMVALSGLHEALAPLAQPEAREKFLEYLVAINAPTELVLNDRDFLVAQWVAHNKNTYLGGLDKARADANAAVVKRKEAQRRAQGAPLPGSRASAPAPQPVDPLSEMIDDFLAPR